MPAGIGRPPGSMPVAAYVLQVDIKLQHNTTALMLRWSSAGLLDMLNWCHEGKPCIALQQSMTVGTDAQDFAKTEKPEISIAIQEAIDIAHAILVEGLERALSGVRA